MPPSPPTRVGSRRTCGAGLGPWAPSARRPRRRRAAGGDDHELDLDAVADDPGQRLGDQRAVAGLEPVLGEAVGDGDPEPVVVDVDELRVAQPRLEVGGRERDLELAEGGAPDLLRVHSLDVILVAVEVVDGRRRVGLDADARDPGAQDAVAEDAGSRRLGAVPGLGRRVPEASQRAVPAPSGGRKDSTAATAAARRSGDFPRILHRGVSVRRRRSAGRPGARRRSPRVFDTPFEADLSSAGRRRASALTGARRVRVPLGVDIDDPGPTERIARQPR